MIYQGVYYAKCVCVGVCVCKIQGLLCVCVCVLFVVYIILYYTTFNIRKCSSYMMIIKRISKEKKTCIPKNKIH